ncbi:MAG TPA: glutathione synthetase, partial [Porticoccaceae bacterium]|nr:glutathione synthetase [Porticoccaceae bacterium]
LFGSGGRNVFLIRPSDKPNIHQMMEVICREEGYMIVQEYLPDAALGDTRLFLVNGDLLKVDGKIAAIPALNIPP